ncbi:aLK and LTK ligand 2a [Nothobranchius furzeri]|uniref:Transcript variant X1 n=4 Tax=Nothobranchius furzeri TaxID=105023 RepID=A0A9D3B8X3_NOTFU|nr:ALK and LTK ligand 2b [Nothobranchius furzeri]KAF7198728.1 transcript variant X2 [Nothobranchius furzeri]KAF7198729.1 transcript variant X1 [Nothobranchius furzeri]
MSEQRKRVLMGLLLLVCVLSEHCGESAPSPATRAHGRNAPRNLKRVGGIVRHVEERRGRLGTFRTEAPLTSRAGRSSVQLRGFRGRTERVKQAVVLDQKMKQKIIEILTGPLDFSLCPTDAYKMYHHTRDCTIPAYLKRCVRLLKQLASSRQCKG